jgi:hypothetical protein
MRCLDEMEIAQLADYFLDQSAVPSDEVFSHVLKCPKCFTDVVEVIEILLD